MEVTTMIVAIVGILAATFLGAVAITQWADVKRKNKPNIYDFLKIPKKEERNDEE